jgi:uncharacterized tellurite resistance protein B-like protein
MVAAAVIRITPAVAEGVLGTRRARRREGGHAIVPEKRSPDLSQANLARLSREERLRLLRFVASFAWADLTIRDEERAFVARLVRRMDLEAEDAREVARWLAVPPSPDDVDPTEVPRAHRQLFVKAAQEVVLADGEVAPEEREYLRLLDLLTR